MDVWTPDRDLRRRCRGALRRLDLPAGEVDLEVVRQRVEQVRGRRIQLTPVGGSWSSHGRWWSTAETEFVDYERDTSPWHQWLIVCHEFAHMLLGHDEGAAISREDLTALFPDLVDVDVAFVLRRAEYGPRREQEAEYLATLLMQQIDKAAALPRTAATPEAAALARLLQTFGDLS